MPFNPHPHGFRTRDWRNLYESFISDLRSLRDTTHAGAIFVFIDAEPWGAEGSKPAEIGMSLLPSLEYVENDARLRNLTWSLNDISSQHHIETHGIRVLGRDRQEKRRQPHRFGQQHELEDDKIEEAVSDIIRRFTLQHGHPSQQTPVILAGFSLYFEFCILSNFYPKLLRFFTSWVDLQETAGQVAIKDERLILPSLRETMVAGGFQDVAAQSIKPLHNAATETTQAAALLIRLLALGEDERLQIKRSSHKPHPRTYRKNPLEKRVWKYRPAPKEIFPYAAKISRGAGFSTLKTAEPLLEIFADHCPVAVGLSGDKRHGWVCLPNLDALEGFVHHVNQLTLDGDVWTAVSAYDATVFPAKTIAELRSAREAELCTLADEKRARRSRKASGTDILENGDVGDQPPY